MFRHSSTPAKPPSSRAPSAIACGILSTFIWTGHATAHSPVPWSAIEDAMTADVPPAPPAGPGIPSSIKTIFVIEHSHLDIGFTAPPSVVAEQHARYLEIVIDQCTVDPDFRWTIESLWMLEAFWLRSERSRQERLLELIAEGRVEVTAGFASMHSSNMSAWDAVRWMGATGEAARRLLGSRPSSVLGNDVPGWSWSLPPILSEAGINLFICGVNDFIGTGAELSRGDYPFWWEGRTPRGVLTWVADGSYAEGYAYYGLLNLDLAHQQLTKRLREWEAADYPYDAILVMRGFDNAEPNLGMAKLARDWNATYDNPRLVLATPSDFLDHLLPQLERVPRMAGDWSHRWDVGAIVTGRGQIRVRRAQRLAPEAEALEVVTRWFAPDLAPASDRRQMRDLLHSLFAWNEHSGGGAPWPGMLSRSEAEQQNREFAQMARKAESLARTRVETAGAHLASLAATGDSLDIVVRNPLPWQRSEIVTVSLPSGWPAQRLKIVDDATGAPIETQPLPGDTTLAAQALDVPPLGYRRWSVSRLSARASSPWPPPAATDAAADVISLEDARFRITIATEDGRISEIHDRGADRAWVAPIEDEPFNGLIRSPNRHHLIGRVHPVGSGPAHEVSRIEGPLLQHVRVQRTRSPHRWTDLVLRRGAPWIEIRNTLLYDQLPYVPLERGFDYHAFRFPFKLPGFEARVSSAAGPMRIFGNQPDQLLGGEFTRWSVGGWVDLSTAHEGLTLLTPDALVAEFETIQYGRNTPPEHATLVSRVLKKCDEGQFSDGSIGPILAEPGEPSAFTVRYGIGPRSDAGWDALRVTRMSRSFASPLQAMSIQPGADAPAAPPTHWGLELSGVATEIIDLKPAQDGQGAILRLRESAGTGGWVQIATPPGAVHRASQTDLFESAGAPVEVHDGIIDLLLGPHRAMALRLE